MSLKIETRVGIAAPIDDVYEIVANLDGWTEWSPIHKKVEGRIGFGAPIHLEEYYEGLGTWETDGAVADWTPLSHIHVTVPKPFYAGQLVRYFEFDALSDAGTSFSTGALFSGFLSEREGRAYRKFLRTGFEAFAEALKTKAETEFALHPDKRASLIAKPEVAPKTVGKPRQNWLKTKYWGKKDR